MQCEIQICPRFKAAWINQLQKTSIGSLWHPNGVRAKVALYVNGDDCYMVNGRFAAACFGFREPTKVILTYEVSDNIFKITTIKNESVEMWSSDGSDDESIIIPNPEDSYQYAETVGPSEEEDNANNCEMPKFRNDRVFGWELLITRAYASLKKQQVLVRLLHYSSYISYVFC
jgi:hypothetical protein